MNNIRHQYFTNHRRCLLRSRYRESETSRETYRQTQTDRRTHRQKRRHTVRQRIRIRDPSGSCSFSLLVVFPSPWPRLPSQLITIYVMTLNHVAYTVRTIRSHSNVRFYIHRRSATCCLGNATRVTLAVDWIARADPHALVAIGDNSAPGDNPTLRRDAAAGAD